MSKNYVVDADRILQMLPHRYPFLLVDRMLEIEKGERAVGLKNVTFNEPFFQGHFPSTPVMPGVLIIESMAQTSAILVVDTIGKDLEGMLVYFMAIDNAKFRRPVKPGDALHIHVEKQRARGTVWRFACRATVEGELCAEAIVTAMIVDSTEEKKGS